MRAIRQYAFGPAENLQYEEAADLEPGEGQVRIAVEAAGVHFIDTTIRAGNGSGPMAAAELPMTPGREVAGTVDAVGPGVDVSHVGKRVVAHLGMANGGYAEQAVAALSSLHELADGIDAETAVAMIGTGRTAMAILDVAQVRTDDVVLVTAAAGGLGTLFVQAAKHAGATVVGLAGGAAKVDRARESGADHAIDYLEPDWPSRVGQAVNGHATLVLDGVGGDAGRAALELLAPGGRIVLFGWSSGKPTRVTTDDLYTLGITASAAIGPRIAAYPGGIRALEARALGEAAAGHLKPVIRRFRLEDAAEAHRALERRATMGKVVLVP